MSNLRGFATRHISEGSVKVDPAPAEPCCVRNSPHFFTLLRLRLAKTARRGVELLIFPIGLFVVLLYAIGPVWALSAATVAFGLVLLAKYVRQMRLEPAPLPRRLR